MRIKRCCCTSKAQNLVSATEEELLPNCSVHRVEEAQAHGVGFSVVCLGTFLRR